MAEHFDLLIRGGTLVDGTGAAAVRGDLGIRGGRIAALGNVRGDAVRTVEADGAVVAGPVGECRSRIAAIRGELGVDLPVLDLSGLEREASERALHALAGA